MTDRGERRIACWCGCGLFYAIRALALIIDHWHVPPRGCCEGDYWAENEWQFRCPTSGVVNRILFNDWDVLYEDREKVGVAAAPTFRSLYPRSIWFSFENAYDEKYETVNNYHADGERERFGLPAKKARA